MNYRHACHAGNFADVVKHVALALCFERLNAKDAPYRYIDTHSGIGLYDFEGDEAGRSPEWKDGVGRVWDAEANASPEVRAALAPWLEVIRHLNTGGLKHYPGSPLIAAEMMRKTDAIRLCELHPESAVLLREAMGRDKRVKIEEVREGAKATLLLSGRLTVNDSPGTLKDAAASLAADGATHVVFDLADVRYVDSACLGEFIASQISLGRRGARLQLARVPDRIMELLKLSGLDGIFDIV